MLINESHEVDNFFYDPTDFDNLIEKHDSNRRVYKKPKSIYASIDKMPSKLVSFFFKRQAYGNPGTLF
ncbi:MAG: hypothetical protein KDH96_08120 [Candidatus Riesia sp.]|nr:hypothetical protein [Candidatus Riesia sp.]